MRHFPLPFLLASLLLVGGCATAFDTPETFVVEPKRSVFMEKNSEAAGAIARFLRKNDLDEQPLLVTTVAQVNSVGSSSTFGRAVREQLSGRLATLGVPVLEPRLRQALTVNDRGEFLLAQEHAEQKEGTPVKTALVGVYSLGKEVVTVHLKLVDVPTQTVLFGYSYALSSNDYHAVSP